MSGATAEWLVVLLVIVLFAGAMIAEIFWLVRGGTAAGRATAFVLATDLFSFGAGSLFVFSTVLAGFMMVMGPAGQGSNTPDAAYWALLIVTIAVPPLVLFLAKRLMLSLLKIRSGAAAWMYSLLSSLFVLAVVLAAPAILVYAIWYASSWK